MKQLFLIVFISAITGCAAQMSTLKKGDAYQLYEMHEDDAFQMIYEEMYNQTDGEVIQSLDGPERGYTVRFYPGLGLDYYDVNIKIVPVSGHDIKGDIRKGLYVQLMGRGTYPSDMPSQIMKSIEKRLNTEGNPVTVTDIKKVDYAKDRDRWRLNDRYPSTREPIKSRSTSDRLRELKKLFDDGVINHDEYEQKKEKLINEL